MLLIFSTVPLLAELVNNELTEVVMAINSVLAVIVDTFTMLGAAMLSSKNYSHGYRLSNWCGRASGAYTACDFSPTVTKVHTEIAGI